MLKKREVVSVPVALPREEEEEASFEEEIAPEEEIPLEEEEVLPEEEEVPPKEEEVPPEEEEILPEEEVLPEEEEALPEISPKVPRPAPGTAALRIKTLYVDFCLPSLKSSVLLSMLLCWVVIKALENFLDTPFILPTTTGFLCLSIVNSLNVLIVVDVCLWSYPQISFVIDPILLCGS